MQNPKIISKNSVRAGDVLLCFAQDMAGKEVGIEHGYSHVAMCINEIDIAESDSAGVRKTNISKLLEDYGHIAVLRNAEIWQPCLINGLHKFTEEKIGKKFNLVGAKKYKERKERNQETLMQQVEDIFDGKILPASADRDVYFCSEFVVSVFIHLGIIGKEATVAFRSETFSPEDIGKDKVFGFFVGYVISYNDYKIPENDYFMTSV
ncbi:hypothetical protein [Chromobacterium aquaticum]|uniref:Peptidoglycan peptidase n=1 Tax=Chromobacterium aquaticum TaxID=467180 RepID=A0ABV8ZPE2_9NEIS|nr:hypothetical protein [Chromobacterium aquaticum]MCD5361247.1 hypothetical protein [Chromobacterium aquaticum]